MLKLKKISVALSTAVLLVGCSKVEVTNMPYVVGMSPDEAITAIEEAGIHDVEIVGAGSVPTWLLDNWEVCVQHPDQGARAFTNAYLEVALYCPTAADTMQQAQEGVDLPLVDPTLGY